MILKTLSFNVLACLLISAYATSIVESDTINTKPLAQIHSVQRNENFLKQNMLSISSLDDNNFDTFVDHFKNLSTSSDEKINTLNINSVNNVKKLFEEIKLISDNIISIYFNSADIDWLGMGKILANLPNVRRLDFNNSMITDGNFEDFLSSYNYHLNKGKKTNSKIHFMNFNRCENITPEGITPSLLSIVTNYNRYPYLLGVGLQQTNRDFETLKKWRNVNLPLLNQAIDSSHSQRLICHLDLGNDKIKGESTLYKGALIFVPHVESQRKFSHSIDMDHAYGDWFDGIPLNFMSE